MWMRGIGHPLAAKARHASPGRAGWILRGLVTHMDYQENHGIGGLESPLEEEFDRKWKEDVRVLVPPLLTGSLADGTSFEIAVAPVPNPAHIGSQGTGRSSAR